MCIARPVHIFNADGFDKTVVSPLPHPPLAVVVDGVQGADDGAPHPQSYECKVQHLAPHVHVVAEQHQVAEARHDEGQQGAAAGTHQGHQLAKVWHLYHYNTGNRHQA